MTKTLENNDLFKGFGCFSYFWTLLNTDDAKPFDVKPLRTGGTEQP